MLISQNYKFSQDWVWVDVVEFEWSQPFHQILTKKVNLMNQELPTLQSKIIEEVKTCGKKIKAIEDKWEATRPRTAEFTPREALDQLNIIGKEIETTNSEWVRLCKAKDLLSMELGDPNRLSGLVDDHALLKNVWSAVDEVWKHIDAINEIPLSAYQYKKVKDELDSLLEKMNEFPNRLRSHNVYDEYKALIQKYRKVNGIFQELKSEAMKSRHWRTLLNQLKIQVKFNDLILFNLWSADLIRYATIVNQILGEARGELILEEFLNGIKETWAK